MANPRAKAAGSAGAGEIDRWHREAVRLHASGQLDRAVHAARCALELAADGHLPGLVALLNELALGLQRRGDLAGARSLYEDALRLQERTAGEVHADTATGLQGLAMVLQKQGEMAAAEPLLRRALQIRRQLHGEEHPEYAATLNRLAVLLWAAQDMDGAEPLLRQSLEIRRAALGEQHPDFAMSLNNLAAILQARGYPARAEPLLRRAVEIRRETLGERHPDYASSLSNLAMTLQTLGSLDEAELLFRRALEVRREALGEDHPQFVANLESLTQLNLARRGRAGARSESPGRVDVEGEAAEGPSTGLEGSTTMAVSTEGLQGALAALQSGYAELADLLGRAAEGLRSAGTPPGEDLSGRLDACRREFFALRDETLRAAESLDLSLNGSDVATLHDLAALTGLVVEAEGERLRLEGLRARALERLGRVLSLRHSGQEAFAPLEEPRSSARALSEAVAASPASGVAELVGPILADDHPFRALLDLVGGHAQLDDDAWSAAHDAVASAFGRPLATAAARARIVENGAVDNA